MAQQVYFHIISKNNLGHFVIDLNLYILFNSHFSEQNALLTATAVTLITNRKLFKAQRGVPFHIPANVRKVKFNKKQSPSNYWQVLEL